MKTLKIKDKVSLKKYNTFGVEVFAQYFTEVQDFHELKYAVEFAKINHFKILFLGGGSNILFTQDYKGLVIKLNLKGIREEILDENHVLVTAKSGENWHEFVQYTLSKNFGGLENLSLIPGNVGTCPIQNIGAYGTEIKDVFHSCKVLNLETLKIEELFLQDCKFGYRDSIFKSISKDQYVILEVGFKLTTGHHHISTAYGAIQTELQKMGIDHPSIQDVSQAVINIRQSKLPNPSEIGNAGSFFKNPTISLEHFEKLKLHFPEIPGYPQQEKVKVPAGWLIEHAGWKGKKIGNVATHHLQALVIINATGKATGKEIFDFSGQIIDEVKAKYQIELEREVNIL